jgi:hypothetical protein
LRDAREFIGEPKKDPLFVRNEVMQEHKNVQSQYTAEHVVMLKEAAMQMPVGDNIS